MRRRRQQEERRMKMIMTAAAVICVLLLVVGVGILLRRRTPEIVHMTEDTGKTAVVVKKKEKTSEKQTENQTEDQKKEQLSVRISLRALLAPWANFFARISAASRSVRPVMRSTSSSSLRSSASFCVFPQILEE